MFVLPDLGRSLVYLMACAPLVTMLRGFPVQRTIPDASIQSGTLSFVGHATVGTFVGATSRVTGAIIGGPDFATTRGWVEAPVASLVTGNDRRDRDLRQSMEVDRYPTMRLDVTGMTVVENASDSTMLMVHGVLAIHGVTRHVDLLARSVRTGDTTRVTANFPLDLADYRIGGLTKMMGLLRMERQIEVRVDLRFVDHPSLVTTP